jgi:hypothetical protein
MKKCALVILIMAFLMVMGSSCGFAQINGRADTSKEGSLLIWPKVQTNDGNETYITITNNSSKDVHVQCYWEVKDVRSDPMSQCLLTPFVIHLFGFNPVVFRASDGFGLDGRAVAGPMGSSEVGALKCWAVDPTDERQISWNHLTGFAVIVNSDTTQDDISTPPTSGWEYSAWRFAANVIESSGAFADGFWMGPTVSGGASANKLNLKASPTTVVNPATCPGPGYNAAGCSQPNAAYDACPKYLTFAFLAEPTEPGKANGWVFNNLALAPCKEDLTDTAANLNTKISYTIWNENEIKYIGLYQCANCAYESYLGKLTMPRNLHYFQMKTLHTPTGRFRVQGLASSKCGQSAVSTPLLGVLSAKFRVQPDTYGTTGTASGSETSDYGYISWVPGTDYYQKPRPR